MDTSARQAARVARILKPSFLVAGLLFIFVTVRIPAQSDPAPPALELAICAVALTSVAAGLFLPKILVPAAPRGPQNDPASTPVKRWFTRCVLSLALFNACNLFAVALHYVGGRFRVVELLFAAGMLSILLWSPGSPPGTKEGAISKD